MKALSLHYNGQLLLVVTLLDSALWDVHSCRRVKTLSGGETVGVQNVSWDTRYSKCTTCTNELVNTCINA